MENNDMQTLADVIGGGEAKQEPAVMTEEVAQQDGAQDGNQPEPGYVQRRIQRATKELTEQYEGRLNEMQGKLNALMEANMLTEARQRVADGDFKSEELAMEYLRMKNGMPAPTPQPVQNEKARDAQGRFVKAENAPSELEQKANELMSQAQLIQEVTGVDVLGLFNSDPEIKQKVLSGEWDFKDVHKWMQNAGQQRVPSIVRSPNRVGLGGYDIRGMSSNDFAKLNQMLEEGGRIDMNR